MFYTLKNNIMECWSILIFYTESSITIKDTYSSIQTEFTELKPNIDLVKGLW